jgi:thiol-disulfide isomerase/thioredoxin
MKKQITGFIAFLLIGHAVIAQNQFETTIDNRGEKIFKGIISRDVIQYDTSFKWYATNLNGYTPNSLALQALRQHGDSIQIIAFMGTWCEDSHFIIPKLFSLFDSAGFTNERLTLVGVDRSKRTLSYLAEALDVRNVPTLIVLKNGKELGRVVEYGKYGMWDKELGEVINSGFLK